MKKIFTILIFSMLLLSVSLVSAHEHNFDETKQLIDSGISCDKLTDEQLEAIGDYYMEQMHPGEAHEMMDQMMGGEGSNSLKQMHITMAKRLYCNEDVGGMMGGGMMNMMVGGMMGGSNSMMEGWGQNPMSWYGVGSWLISLLWLVWLIVGILATIWLWKQIIKK
ncbi:MAG: hypothetical protein Q8P20_10420 [bacterium]|nr:hypothetical protein [bacterium]